MIKKLTFLMAVFTAIFNLSLRADDVPPQDSQEVFSANGQTFNSLSSAIDEVCLNQAPNFEPSTRTVNTCPKTPLSYLPPPHTYSVVVEWNENFSDSFFSIYSSISSGLSCPSTHPVHNDLNSDGVIDEFDTCSQLPPCDGHNPRISNDPFVTGHLLTNGYICIDRCPYTQGLGDIINPTDISGACSEQCSPNIAGCYSSNSPLFSEAVDNDGDGNPDPSDANDPTDTSDDIPDPDPNPADDDGDGDNSDELDLARNQFLDQIEDNTDELEQLNKNQIKNDNSNTQKLLGALSAIAKEIKEKPVSGGGGGTSGDGGEEEPSCDKYELGGKCEDIPNKQGPSFNATDFSEVQAKIATVKSDLTSFYSDMKLQVEDTFNFSMSGGSYTSNTKNIFGVEVDFGAGRLLQDMNIGSVVIFIFSIMALFVLLGGRGNE